MAGIEFPAITRLPVLHEAELLMSKKEFKKLKSSFRFPTLDEVIVIKLEESFPWGFELPGI